MANRRKKTQRKRCTACGKMFQIIEAIEKEGFIQGGKYHTLWKCPYCSEWNGKNLSALKAYAWKLFAKSVKWLWSDRITHRCRCVTCGVELHREDSSLHAGHFLGGRGKGILFDRRCVHPQCRQCNVILRGNSDAYWPFMLNMYGMEVCDELLRKKSQHNGSWTHDELRAVIHDSQKSLAHYDLPITHMP